WRSLRRCAARIGVQSQLSLSYYKRPIRAWVTAQRLLRRPFLGSIRSGTLCAAIPLSKNSARKSRNNFTTYYADDTDVLECGAVAPLLLVPTKHAKRPENRKERFLAKGRVVADSMRQPVRTRTVECRRAGWRARR